MLFCYNQNAVGDVLLGVVQDDRGEELAFERRGDIARVYLKDSGETVAWNIFNISQVLNVSNQNGQVELSKDDYEKLNELLRKGNFDEQFSYDASPKIVVGFVEECEKHPNSDHLSVTQTRVSDDTVLQIVCGAPNIEANQKVVVALEGTMMPDGMMIWPGVLRGEESHGMICSARELNVPNAPEKKGILVLNDDATIGEAFVVK